MKKKHHFTCIVCPVSCQIELVEKEGRTVEVSGGECKLGEEYARKEFTNPERVLTTTVRVEGGVLPVLPVRTEKPIAKKLIKSCMKKLTKVIVKAPVKCGEVVYANILDTGVNIIASRDMPAEEASCQNETLCRSKSYARIVNPKLWALQKGVE